MNKTQTLRRNHSWPLLVALAAPIPLACVAPAGTDATDDAGGKAPAGGDNSLAGSSGDGGSQIHPTGGNNGSGGNASGGNGSGGANSGGASVGGSSAGGANQAGAGGDDGSGGSSCTGDCPVAVTQIAAGSQHNCALSVQGEVTCWGHNAVAELGLGVSSVAALPPKRTLDLGETQRAVSITAGGEHNCATFEDGSVKCWGAGRYGELGSGSTENVGDNANEMGSSLEPVNLGSQARVLSMVGGYEHSCALLTDGGLKCWGYNAYGQLGLGDVANRGDEPGEMGDALPYVDLGAGRVIRSLAAGAHHTCALFDDGSVKCWGFGLVGQLGSGVLLNRGSAPGEMGDSLPTIDLGSGRSAKAISAGGTHTCAILDDDSVKCWGDNTRGQLGLGDIAGRGDAPNEMGDALPRVELGTGRSAKALHASLSHTCAILDNNSVKCWGWGQYGILGQGNEISHGTAPGQMGDALPAIPLDTARAPLAITVGGAHTCALLDQGAVKCWGANWYAQLGNQFNSNLGDEPGEMGDNLPEVSLW